jgi:hypothetical protein
MHATLIATHAARDWEGMRRLASEDFRFEDRGKRALVEGGVETWLASMQFVASHPEVRFDHELLATLGDRIQLGKLSWIGESADAEFHTDKLRIIEVDASGRLRRVVLFDIDDRRAAVVDALARFVAGEASGAEGPASYVEFARGLATLDWDAVREVSSPALVFDDRRPLGLGVLSREQWIASLRIQAEMAPDVSFEPVRVLAWNRHGFVVSMRTHGNLRDGGPFENVFLSIQLASGGKLVRVEPHPIDAEAEALARFEELTRDPFGVVPNMASVAGMRSGERYSAGDWQAFRTLARADFQYEDRSRRALLTGDLDTWIASMQFVREQFASRTEHELVATFGDSVEVRRFLFVGDPDGAAIEIERLRLTEVDERGMLAAVVFFDPEDRAAACVEGLRRFVERESPELMPVVGFVDALRRHDWESFREVLSDDCVLDDHRPLSFGIIDKEQWLASLVAQAEMAPDFSVELLRVLAWTRHGALVLTRTYGSLRDGGPFENVFLAINLVAGGRLTLTEPYAIADGDRALARFHEICAALDA